MEVYSEGLPRLPGGHTLRCEGSEGIRQVKAGGEEDSRGKDSKQVAVGNGRSWGTEQQRGESQQPPRPTLGSPTSEFVHWAFLCVQSQRHFVLTQLGIPEGQISSL